MLLLFLSSSVMFQLLYIVTARNVVNNFQEKDIGAAIVRSKYYLPLNLMLEADLPSASIL